MWVGSGNLKRQPVDVVPPKGSDKGCEEADSGANGICQKLEFASSLENTRAPAT